MQSLLRMLLPDLVGIIGVYDQKNPRLFFVSPDGIAEEQQSFGAEGSGGTYAEYALPRMWYDGIPVAEAEICAIHIVEQAKHVDPHSGGPTQLASIGKSGIKHWSASAIQKMTTRLRTHEQYNGQQWRKTIKSFTSSGRRKK
jgi:20S proteasome alpha/beta subunit